MTNLLDQSDTLQGWDSAKGQYSFHPWDPPTELIQGAVRELLDSPNSHFKTLAGLGAHLKIWISEKDRTIRIIDYGGGFSDLSWLALHNSSHKKAKKVESGFGIGLTAILAQSDIFRIISRWGISEIMEATFTGVNSGLEKAIKDSEAGKTPNKSMLDETYSKYTGKITDIPIDSGWKGPFTYFEVKADKGMSHMWDFIDSEGGTIFLESILYHSALGLTHKVHGKPLPRDLMYELTFEDKSGKNKVRKEVIGNNDLIPGHPHCTKIVDAKQKPLKATNAHFLSYEHKGKPGTKPDHLIVHIQAYAAFSKYGGKNGKERISAAYGEFLQKGKTKGGTSNVFISVNNFPQPIRVEIPYSEIGNKSTIDWTAMFVDVDKNVMESGRNAISKVAAEQLNPKIVDAINAIEKKYHDDKGTTTSSPGVPTGIGGAGAKGATTSAPYLPAPTAPATTAAPATAAARATATAPATAAAPATILLHEPVSEDEVELLFTSLCQSGYIEGVKIYQKGHNNTTYDWTIRPSWPVSCMGAQHQVELEKFAKKNSISFNISKTLHEIINQDLHAETKIKINKFVTEVSKTTSKKKIEEVEIVIVWDSKLSAPQKKIWDLRKPIPAEKIHPQITHILENKSDPSKNAQVFVLSDFFP